MEDGGRADLASVDSRPRIHPLFAVPPRPAKPPGWRTVLGPSNDDVPAARGQTWWRGRRRHDVGEHAVELLPRILPGSSRTLQGCLRHTGRVLARASRRWHSRPGLRRRWPSWRTRRPHPRRRCSWRPGPRQHCPMGRARRPGPRRRWPNWRTRRPRLRRRCSWRAGPRRHWPIGRARRPGPRRCWCFCRRRARRRSRRHRCRPWAAQPQSGQGLAEQRLHARFLFRFAWHGFTPGPRPRPPSWTPASPWADQWVTLQTGAHVEVPMHCLSTFDELVPNSRGVHVGGARGQGLRV